MQVAASLQNVRNSSNTVLPGFEVDKVDNDRDDGDDATTTMLMMMDVERRKRICSWCVDTIHRHLCLMNSVCKGIITENKLQSATIGLLYLMRNGIVVHELVVLPRLQARTDIFV